MKMVCGTTRLNDNRVVVPAGEARERVLEEAHDSPYSGHFGKDKVLHQTNQNFWWPGWRKDVESYVFGCLEPSL
jgi:hypothetical protein